MRRDAGIDNGDSNATTSYASILLQPPLAPRARLIGRERAVGDRHRGDDGKIAGDAQNAWLLPQMLNALCVCEEHNELVETPENGKPEPRCGGFHIRTCTSDNNRYRQC